MKKPKAYHLQTELEAIKHAMAEAMQNASVQYVATGRHTKNMQDALRWFWDWARRAAIAGL